MATRPNANPTHKTISFGMVRHLSIIYDIMIYCIKKELVNLEYNISQNNDIIDVQSSLVNHLNE